MKTRFIPFDPDAIASAGKVVPLPGPSGHEAEDEGPGTSRPLTRRQKWILADLARHVFDDLKDRGKLAGIDLEDWRHHVSVKACGHRISQASHGDFKRIQAAFLHERGDEEGGRRALVQATSTPQAIALFKLRETLKKTGTPAAYAETLARRFYKNANLADLTAKQVWTLVFTLRNNANQAKGGPGKRFKSRKAGGKGA